MAPNQKTDWRIFLAQEPVAGASNTLSGPQRLAQLPAAPPWRPFGRNIELKPPPETSAADGNLDYLLARSFRATPEMEEAVNASLYLRRPLLVTGKPGNGKSSLIRAVAKQLQLGPVLRWSITSKSTLKEGLYLYDALGRLDAQNRRPKQADGGGADDSDIGEFIELGPLGTALLESDWPRALLIDEIDKADLDLPNDLLNIFEEGEYSIPELARAKVKDAEGKVKVRTWKRMEETTIQKGYVRCSHFPFVVLTSNREREFPPAFMRRCIRIGIEEPDETMLGDIVESHFDKETRTLAKDLITTFVNSRSDKKELATDQLLNAVYLLLRTDNTFNPADKKTMVEKIFKPISGPEATR